MMPPIRCLRAALVAAALSLVCALPAAAVTANGRLQIIHLDVGQGDGALLITPLGQVVLIDEGPSGTSPACGVTVLNQLTALGVTHVDYHFASHYHADHIGNIQAIANGGITIDYGWDRGGSYSSGAYTNYVNTLGNRRRMMVKNQVVTLDSLSAHPVTIKCVDLNAAGVSTTDENTLSMVLKVSYGEFDESFGGDLGGQNSGSYHDIETLVAPEMGPVEVLKVHHHGSATSTNDTWLGTLAPQIAVISEGNGNSYGHPTAAALTRLHNHSVRTYWTETGAGVAPDPTWDKVSNNQVVISATWEPGGVDTVRGTGFADTFVNSGTPAPDVVAPVASVTSPNGGEVWKVGSSHPITWTASDNVGVTTVDLAWSPDGGTTWNAVATGIANVGSYAWAIPAGGSTNALVRVTAHDAAGNLGRDSSAAAFTIDYWTVAATAGPGGAIAPAGTVNAVQGSNRNFTITPVAGCQIADVVVDGTSVGAVAGYLFVNVTSDHTIAASFLDQAAPTVAVTSPAGGEAWDPGSAHDITWTATDNVGVDSVSIEYSVSGRSGPWLMVARGLANSGSYTWTVPTASTDSAAVRVTARDRALNSAAAISDSLFRIGAGSLAVGDPGPRRLALARPSPNPSTGPVRVSFSLPHEAGVTLEVLDVSGRRVWQAREQLPAGTYSRVWDGRDGGAGLYFVRLITPWGALTERLVRLQ